MKRLVSASVLVGMGRLLAACDPIYGISRLAWLQSLPELPCVEAAIRSVPEVRSVRRWNAQGSRPLTLTGIKPSDQLHYFAYDVGPAEGTLYLRVNYKGDVELSQHLVSIGSAPPQEKIDSVRPVMLRIEKVLEERCGVKPLADAIEEYCSGVECEAE